MSTDFTTQQNISAFEAQMREALAGLPQDEQTKLWNQYKADMQAALNNSVGDTLDIKGAKPTADQTLAAQADAQRQLENLMNSEHPLAEAIQAKQAGFVPTPKEHKGIIRRFKDNVGLVWTAWMISLLGAGTKEKPEALIKGLDPITQQLKGGFFSKATLYNLFPSLADSVDNGVLKGALGDVVVEASDEATRNTKWMTRQWNKAGTFKKIILWPLKKMGQAGEWMTSKLYWVSDKADDAARSIQGSNNYANAASRLKDGLHKLSAKSINIGGKPRSLEVISKFIRRQISKLTNTHFGKLITTKGFGFGKDIARNLGYTGRLGKAALIITSVFALGRGIKNIFFGKGEDPYYGTQASAYNSSFNYDV